MNLYTSMPHIVKETSGGFFRSTLQDELFQIRTLQCFGEITAESAHSLMMQLQYLARANPGEEITLYINSPGGEVSSGLALYDVMQTIDNPIRTVCMGTAASMGALLFISGDRRDMLPHSQVMIHDPLREHVGGSALEIEKASRRLMQTREITAKIISKHSGQSLEAVLEKTAEDSFFSAEEAIAFGLADNIISEL